MDSLVLAEAANIDVTLEDAELLIDEDYESPMQPIVEAAIQAKWSKILGPDAEIVVCVNSFCFTSWVLSSNSNSNVICYQDLDIAVLVVSRVYTKCY